MIVKNLEGRSGRPVVNQYNIVFKGIEVFQSYNTVIACIKDKILYMIKSNIVAPHQNI